MKDLDDWLCVPSKSIEICTKINEKEFIVSVDHKNVIDVIFDNEYILSDINIEDAKYIHRCFSKILEEVEKGTNIKNVISF